MCRLSTDTKIRPTCPNTSLSIRRNISQQVKYQCVVFKIFLYENSFFQVSVQRKGVSCLPIVLDFVLFWVVKCHQFNLGKTQFSNLLLRKFLIFKFVSNAKKRGFPNNSQREFSQNRFWLLHLQIPKKIVFRVLRENTFDSNLYQFANLATIPSKSIRKL